VTPRLVLATANSAKAAELRALLDGLGYDIRTLHDYPGVTLPAEGATSYAENARAKAQLTALVTGAIGLGDDSGLEVAALGGRPGVASARYGGPGLSDAGRVACLLGEAAGTRSRAARFRCVLALVAPWGEEAIVEGVVEGRLTERPRGTEGFGYDPIFLLPDLGRTFAELTPAEKHRLSHRARAVSQARPILTRWATRSAQSA
jgi:XTP/dITP diphosphohydrolase